MTKHPLFIHPNTPPKLVTMFRRAIGKNGKGYNFIALAEQLGVNRRYVHDLITKGIEPSNPEIREKLFLKKPHKAHDPASGAGRKPYTEPPEHIKWWRSIAPEARHELIRRAHVYFQKGQNANAQTIHNPSDQ